MTMQESPPTPSEGGQNPLTRKLGPLPTWGWALALGGGFILFRIVSGKSAFPSAGGTPTPVGAITNPVIPGSEISTFANYSASDIATLAQALKQAGIQGWGAPAPPSTAAPPAKKVDFAGSKTAFGTIYPKSVHTLSEAIAWYFRAIKNGAKPKTAFSPVPVH